MSVIAMDDLNWDRIVTLLITFGGWGLAGLQFWAGTRSRRLESAREQRQAKINRILEHLDVMAELVGLYRVLARASYHQKTNENGDPILDGEGNVQIEYRAIFADEYLEDGLRASEGADKNIVILLKAQTYRLHRDHAKVGDWTIDLDPSFETRKQLNNLYSNIRRLEGIAREQDFNRFTHVLEEADRRRTKLRIRVQDLIDGPPMIRPIEKSQ